MSPCSIASLKNCLAKDAFKKAYSNVYLRFLGEKIEKMQIGNLLDPAHFGYK
jgi:hypothetical protein